MRDQSVFTQTAQEDFEMHFLWQGAFFMRDSEDKYSDIADNRDSMKER